MNGTLTLKNPVMINGDKITEMKYDTNEIDGVLFATAEAKRKAAAGMKNLSVSAAAEFDFGLHLYLGYAAIVAVNPTYLYGYTHAGTTTCGTYPQPGTLGAVIKQAAAAEPDTEAFRYNYPECGITPRPGTLGSVIKRAAATNEKAALFCYPFVKCGTKRCGE